MEVRLAASSTPAERSARAQLLAERYPAAAQILTFYARLTEYLDDEPLHDPRGDFARAFLEWLGREAPPALAHGSSALTRLDDSDWEHCLSLAFTDVSDDTACDPIALFVAEAIVQRYAEHEEVPAALREVSSDAAAIPARCPRCACAPVVGVLREEGHGAKRGLVCARCSTEWPYPRISCPACGEQEFDALPRYTAQPYDHIRIDACDRCRRYLKTIDLTKDGLAVPQVDDLASLPLDLWAREQGYRRLRDNLMRT